MDFIIRDAAHADLDAIESIYNHYVENSTCTYQLTPDPPQIRIDWWHDHVGKYPVLVAVGKPETPAEKSDAAGPSERREPHILGWACLSRWSKRMGYRFIVENSIYLRHDVRSRGIGRELLSKLLDRGRSAGFHTVMALIAGDQPASMKLHASLGFTEVGRMREVGNKFDRWLDTVFMQCML